MKGPLLDPIVPPEKLHPVVAQLRGYPGFEPARLALEEVFKLFDDPDGNFVEQFQSTAFDARIFELYLFAYFLEAGFEITRPPRPDFLLKKDDVVVAVEATTSNPSQPTSTDRSRTSEKVDSDGESRAETAEISQNDSVGDVPSEAELEILRDRAQNEHPIKIGSALFSKLKKRYWELPEVEGKPFVIAVEAFHTEDSLFFSSAGIASYLYGNDQTFEHDIDGKLTITNRVRISHKMGSKEIPSNFFAQPDAENISAVLFTNSGTVSKFTRMGYQAGLHRGNITVSRAGHWFDPDPKASKARALSYTMDEPPFLEPWGNGVTIFHNPNAKHPLPRGFFPDSVETYWEDEQLYSDGSANSPFISRTITLLSTDSIFTPVDNADADIGTILQAEFETFLPPQMELREHFAIELAWFATKDRILIGTVFLDRPDRTFHCAILGRDPSGTFRGIYIGDEFTEKVQAIEHLLVKLAEFRSTGQTVFPQDE